VPSERDGARARDSATRRYIGENLGARAGSRRADSQRDVKLRHAKHRRIGSREALSTG